MNRKIIFGLLVIAIAFACDKDSKVEKEIGKINIDVKVERFDEIFAAAHPNDLPKLKKKFPFLFPERISDSVWIKNMQDTLQEHLLSEVHIAFPNFDKETEDIKSLFQHLKYYDKTFSVPRMITLTNYVDYRNKVIVTDTIDLIALDNYLGEDHEFYADISRYLAQEMTPSQIIPDLAKGYAEKYIFQPERKTLLDDMIYFGKELYFKDKMIPFVSDADKIGYTQKQLDWAISNESYIWRFFIEKELLYSTDTSLASRFINPAPYSKFYLELDSESPGRLGQYMGWQIVRSFMEHNNVGLMDMLQMDASEIFNNAKFKPRKE